MKTERWFKVLVLGGAMVGQACGTVQEGRPNRRAAGTGGSTSGSGGESSPGDGIAGSSGSTAGSGGVSLAGAGGADASAAGGASSGSGAPSGSGAASSGDGGSGGAGGVAGSGSGGQLECRVDASGHGDARDPCGCPCCWAKDCLNTETPCCVGFCKSADEGRGCCPQ
ncbi:MAG TPA: hypothetical protein VHP33_32730 [Polyangiaceae bacterium]|nr:hypothetical protein [Polyangiaceae bacterium]